LSFWAKRGYINTKASVGSPAAKTTFLDFELDGLTSDWRLYTLEPVQLSEVVNQVPLRLKVNNLSATEAFYLDNITLKEVTDNLYLIRDSWVTPNSCEGQLGCQQYLDRQDQVNYLKSFDFVCSSTAIGCEAYLDTQNSSAYQSARDYNEGTCDASVGEIINGDCKIRNKFMCVI